MKIIKKKKKLKIKNNCGKTLFYLNMFELNERDRKCY